MVGIGYAFGKAAPPAPATLTVAGPSAPGSAQPPVADVDGVLLGATGGIRQTYALGASTGVPALPRSVPFHLTVPRVGIDTDLMVLGQAPDRTVEVPPDVDDSPAGWYGLGSSPGEPGPAVVLGHVDSHTGPAVFFNLGSMRAGDEVSVLRRDGTRATFTVDRVARYAKSDFPTRAVYGDTGQATLRLVTCGGRFDRDGGGYTENVIVFATLSGTESTDGDPQA
jgi:hypothetical protein